MLGLDMIRLAERGVRISAQAGRQQQQQPRQRADGKTLALSLLAVAAAVTVGVIGAHHHPGPGPAVPAVTTSWYQDRACGLPKQDFDTVQLDLQGMQLGYQNAALNLPNMATALQTDTAAARACEPSLMPPAQRHDYNLGLAQAAAAAQAASTNPAAIGGHLTAAQTLLNSVAAKTGENA